MTQPFTSARVTLIEGEQGSGKSATATARMVDAWYNDAIENFVAERAKKLCRCIGYDFIHRTAKIKLNGQIKKIRIPPDYKLHSDLKIFCNYHLYGIPYVFCPSFDQTMLWLKDGTITNGKLTIDEAYIGVGSRVVKGMGALARELTNQSFQYRKMQLEVSILSPLSRLVDWTARLIPNERILCSYDEDTGYVNLEIKKKGAKTIQQISYDSRRYRRFYWTNERINN